MALMRGRRSGLGLLAAGLLGVGAVFQAYTLYQADQFNDALKRQDLAAAARHSVDEARIAEALVLQSGSNWQAALEIYAELEQTVAGPLAQIARFNMANLYLRRGMEMSEAGSMDVALPLIEMAKTAYRAALRADPEDWEARFNLARALQIVPDVDSEEVEDDIMPERSQRSLLPMDARSELP